MDVDEDDEEPVKGVPDYGIEVDFESLDEDEREVCYLCSGYQRILIYDFKAENSSEALAELDAQISKLVGDIERMAPNMKAMDKSVNC